MQLRKYQEEISTDAAKLLEWQKIAYLAMEVRTGKTITSLVAAEKFGAKVVLFVTKKKAISSIQDDYDTLNPSFIIDIINFESLHNVVRQDYDLIIVDEAHSLSQYPTPSERTRLLKQICAGKPIVYLSGTPTPESFSQLYHQFYISSFSPFKDYKNFYSWAKEFVTMKKKYLYSREINDYSNADKTKIDLLTKHLFISYTQQEAGFEQEVQEEVLTVRMMPATYALAKRLITKRIYIGTEGEEILADTAVKLQNKLHQVYSGTVLAEDGNAIVFDSTKANFIRDHFKGKKIAIFYKFRAEALMLITTFGSDRLTEDPKEFNERSDLAFYSQIQSGSMGTNLSTAEVLVMMNIDFSNVQYWQVRARMQSKDRTMPALMCWIFSENGIEQKILAAVRQKKDYVLSYFKKDFQIQKELA